MLSYHNDKTLKKDMVEEMALHQKHDALVKGSYGKMNGIFKGCAVGCGVQSLNVRRNLDIAWDDHKSYADALGIPIWLARLEDSLFESLPEKEAKQFPLKFITAIPVGRDLEPVKWPFCSFILEENIERVLTLTIDAKLKEQAVSNMRDVFAMHKKTSVTGKFTAEFATRSAAWQTARYVTDYVASAAESTADYATKAAAYIRYADCLLKLLRNAK